MDFGNHRYTDERNCILIWKCDMKKKNVLTPNPKTVPTALISMS